jgi:thioredoxin reductase
VQVDPAALELEFVDVALAVVLAAGFERKHLGIAGHPLERRQHVSYCHVPSVASQAPFVRTRPEVRAEPVSAYV